MSEKVFFRAFRGFSSVTLQLNCESARKWEALINALNSKSFAFEVLNPNIYKTIQLEAKIICGISSYFSGAQNLIVLTEWQKSTLVENPVGYLKTFYKIMFTKFSRNWTEITDKQKVDESLEKWSKTWPYLETKTRYMTLKMGFQMSQTQTNGPRFISKKCKRGESLVWPAAKKL